MQWRWTFNKEQNSYARLSGLWLFVTDGKKIYTYTSRPEDSSALLWYKFRIHINHLTLPDVDESAVGGYEVIQGCGHGENIW